MVDHIVPHKGDQARFWCEANWQPSCAWHHDSIKAKLEARYPHGGVTATDLRLDSAMAIKLTKATPRRPRSVDIDGWPVE